MQSPSLPCSEGSIDPCIETYSGWMIDFTDPDPEVINIIDIATALSRINRYNGHSLTAWSVTSHSLLCVDFAKQYFGDVVDDWLALHILLHDAHEAYTGDIVTPLKYMPDIKPHVNAIEARLQAAIEVAFDIGHPAPSEQKFIKMIDEYALAIEGGAPDAFEGQALELPFGIQ